MVLKYEVAPNINTQVKEMYFETVQQFFFKLLKYFLILLDIRICLDI